MAAVAWDQTIDSDITAKGLQLTIEFEFKSHCHPKQYGWSGGPPVKFVSRNSAREFKPITYKTCFCTPLFVAKR